MSKRSYFTKPLFHFLLLGGLLFFAQNALLDARTAPEASLLISAADIESIEKDWRLLTGAPPSTEERARLIEQRIDDEILIEEAIRLGWHLTDPVIQDRLIRNVRFIQPESQETDAALLRQARDMGMDRSDLVVRRRLIERMKMLISTRARAMEPSEQELNSYYQEHAQAYQVPEKIELTQLYLSQDLRGDSLQRDANALLQDLLRAQTLPTSVSERGDPFLHPRHFPLSSKQKYAARFGDSFAKLAFEETDSTWAGPIPSSYGLHLIWIHDRSAPYTPTLDEIRSSLLRDIQSAKERALLTQTLKEYREYWVIQIEDSRP